MKPYLLALFALLGLLAFAACGGDNDAPNESAPADNKPTGTASTPASATPENETEEPTQATGPISVIHAMGTLELDAPAMKVAVLEWTYAEDLLALGMQPAGVADIEGYGSWVKAEPPLGTDVVELGTRQEPSIESIAQLEPDLIIGVQFRHEPIYNDLNAIAPTVLFNPYPAEGEGSQYDEMETTFREIAKAVGKEAEAEAVLTDLQEHFDAAASTLSEVDLATQSFVIVQAFTSQGSPAIRLFSENAMAVAIVEKLGLENAYSKEYEQYGFTTTSVEGLVDVQDANFFYVVQEEDDIFANQLAENPIWSQLQFVQEGRTYPLGGDTWLFGGPLSARLVVDQVVALLTAE